MEHVEENSEARRELSRFFAIASILRDQGVAVNMPVSIVDQVWHDLDAESSDDVLTDVPTGIQVKHLPNQGTGCLEWVPHYEVLFGQLSRIWFIDQFGHFDEVAYTRYQHEGVWRTSWDCSPGIIAQHN